MIVLRNSLKLYMHVYVITVGIAIGLYVFHLYRRLYYSFSLF